MSLDRYIRSGGVVSSSGKQGISLLSRTIFAPILGIVLSELLLFFGYTQFALAAHLLTLLGCVLAPLRYDSDLSMLQVFALVPIFRLVNLGMPVFFELTIYWFPLIYGPLIPAVYLIGQSNSYVTLNSGWKAALIMLPLAIPISGALGAIEYLILEPPALIPSSSLPNLLLLSAVMILFVGFVEELLFRGVLQQSLKAHIGRWPAIFLASAVFGLMHSGYQVPAELVFAGTIGFVFGVIYDRTDSIVLVTIMHGVLNIFLFAILPFNGDLSQAIPLPL